MSGRNEQVRRETQASGSPLAKHSMNQKNARVEQWGKGKLDGISHRNKKSLRRAKARFKSMQESTIGEASNDAGIAPKGTIVFAEDLGLGK